MNAPLMRWWIPDGFLWGLYEKIMREGPDFLHYPDKALLPDPLFARFFNSSLPAGWYAGQVLSFFVSREQKTGAHSP